MRTGDLVMRPATPGDALVLAKLLDAAGEGLPRYLWSLRAEPGEDAMAVGARRAAGTEGGFSHVHAHVAQAGEEIAGMLLSYRLPESVDPAGFDEAPAVVRPLLELEGEAPGSWYVNTVAAMPVWRGRGVGSRLMALADELARGAGADTVSLIVAEDNAGARRLYERLGYTPVARRSVVPFPGSHHAGDWILMTKPLASRA